jgi:hypothetical protein
MTWDRKMWNAEVAPEVLPGKCAFSDLECAHPDVSRDVVCRVLRQLYKAGKVVCRGHGHGRLGGEEVISLKEGNAEDRAHTIILTLSTVRRN